MIEIQCKIDGIIYKNDVTGYAVLSAHDIELGRHFTIVFNNGILNPRVGFNLIVSGEWVNDKKYGQQFKAVEYKEVMPTENDSIVSFLSCGLFKGIGEKIAKKIVSKFGSETLNIIENNPDKLKEVKGLGAAKIFSLVTGFIENKSIQDLVSFFSQYGFTINMIMKIYKEYGRDAVELVKENPYRLASEIDGIGFKRADDVAMKLGIDKYDFNRQASGIEYALLESAEDGHTFLYEYELLNKAIELLGIESSYIKDTISSMIESDDLMLVDNDKIFSKLLYYSERNSANRIKRIRDFERPYTWNKGAPISIEEIEEKIGIKYNEKQKEAIELALKSNVMVLTGGPGTGKTTALLGIIEKLLSVGYTIACAAPTGRAAKRMSEVTGMEAKTIHRLLEYNPVGGYNRNEQNPIFEEVVILDEVSMVNILLMNSLLKALKPSVKLILVGDENQLPCIGPGDILHDIIESNAVPVVTLNEIFRQAEDSRIIINSHNIINEKPIIINNTTPGNDFFFIQKDDPQDIERTIEELVSQRLPQKYNVEPTDIQVLSPRRKDADCSANSLNKILQKALNKSELSITYGETEFKYGDKVMQIKNNYEKGVFNGDVGFISNVDLESRELVVTFDDELEVEYSTSDLDEIVLAYASTIHKAQGSEYPIVIIPVIMSHYIMLKRNLIYTGITRAKNVCILIGQLKAFDTAIKNKIYGKRNTMLCDWLIDNEINTDENE